MTVRDDGYSLKSIELNRSQHRYNMKLTTSLEHVG